MTPCTCIGALNAAGNFQTAITPTKKLRDGNESASKVERMPSRFGNHSGR